MTIGNRISKLRKEKGISQEALGEHLGVSRQAVSRWELDQSVPDITTLNEIASFFEVSVIYLLDDSISLSTNNNPPRRKKLEYGMLVLMALSVLISVITIGTLNKKINMLEERVNYFNYILNQPQPPINEFPTHDFLQINTIEFINYDYRNKSVDVSIELLPNVEPKDLKVILYINEDSFILEKKASQTYMDVINVPLVERIEVKVVLESAEETKTIPLISSKENITSSLFYILPQINSTDSGKIDFVLDIQPPYAQNLSSLQSLYDGASYFEDGKEYPYYRLVAGDKVWIESAQLKWIDKDGNETILDENAGKKIESIYGHSRYKYKNELPKDAVLNQTYELAFEITDNLNRKYQVIFYKLKKEKDGFMFVEVEESVDIKDTIFRGMNINIRFLN